MLIIGSRGSPLALWQARWVQAKLGELGERSRIEIIKTTGDKITDAPLAKIGAKGLFTKEIEEALLDGRVDLAVHSLKDLPTSLPAGLGIAAIPAREDPRDAIIGSRLNDLPQGAKVGTSSLRRMAQLRALRPDLAVEPLRGNLDTRLRKLDLGLYDAIVVAYAGLKRLGMASRATEILNPESMCPAVGQGALGIETRLGGDRVERICRALDDLPSRVAVTAERAVLASLGGGCQVPIGVYARLENGVLKVTALVASPDGHRVVRLCMEGDPSDPLGLGKELGRRLLAAGAREILERVYDGAPPSATRSSLAGRRVVVTRARDQAEPLVSRLRALGAEVIELPTIEIHPASDYSQLDAAIRRLPSYDWIIFTSVNGVRLFMERLALAGFDQQVVCTRLCAIGPATRKAIERLGLKVEVMPEQYVAESLVKAFAEYDLSGKRILLPRAAVARDLVPTELAARGASVDVVEVYRTAIPEDTASRAAKIFSSDSKPHWVTFTSSSTVRNFVACAGRDALKGVRVASIGPVTSATARSYGIEIAAEATVYTIEGLLDALVAAENVAAS
jgi:hydroxymethylbilane synthase